LRGDGGGFIKGVDDHRHVVGFIRRKKDYMVGTQRGTFKDFSNCEWPVVS
jgi:hypothetical protein